MITVIAHLWAADGNVKRLEKFEKKALPLVNKHGGTLLAALRPEASAPDHPDEIHVLRFPDLASFSRFRADPAHQKLGGKRQKAIARSELFISAADVEYRGIE